MTLTWARNGMWALLVLVVGGGLSYALLTGKAAPEPERAPDITLPSVDVVVAAPADRSLPVYTQGSVLPLREIKLMSQVGGRVERVSPRFAQGGFFSADELLVKVEDVDYRFAIARAEAQVAASKQTVAEEEGRALQANREWRDLGSVKANALFLREPQLASARASLKAAQADLDAAHLDLTRTEITGPFNGRITEKNVDIGQFVGPGAAIATVYDTDVVQVRLPLTDRQVALLELPLHHQTEQQREAIGADVQLRARFGNQDWEWQGRIVRTDATIDLNSRVVYAVAEVERPFAQESGSERPPLSPGLFVHATIHGKALPQVSQLPRTALRSDGTVMVVDSDQRAVVRAVILLQSDSDSVWVQGLEGGERVIVRQPFAVHAGMDVVVKSPADAPQGET